jgi:hypothetical protein
VVEAVVTCERCLRPSEIGEHGLFKCPLESRRSAAVKPDTLLGGFVAENAWREPRYFDSQKAYERALDADGMMLKPKRVSGDKVMDPQTLENARVLVSRNAPALPTFTLETRVLEETLTVTLDATA